MARGKSTGRFTPSRAGEDEGSGDAWLTTYGDAITLLMAFFVMLYAMSTTDAQKFQELVAGLEAPFGNTAVSQGLLESGGGIVGPGGSQPGPPVEAMVPPQPDLRPESPLATPEPKRPEPKPSAQPARARPPVPDQLEKVRVAVDDALQRAGLGKVAKYRRNERGLVVSIAADDVLFATGSTQIGPFGRRVVTTIGAALRRFPNDILVEGHTDNAPLRRGGYTNWNLSTDRAVAVLQLLRSVERLRPERLGAVGYGEFRPTSSNATAAGRSQNRRVDILVIAEGAL